MRPSFPSGIAGGMWLYEILSFFYFEDCNKNGSAFRFYKITFSDALQPQTQHWYAKKMHSNKELIQSVFICKFCFSIVLIVNNQKKKKKKKKKILKAKRAMLKKV